MFNVICYAITVVFLSYFVLILHCWKQEWLLHGGVTVTILCIHWIILQEMLYDTVLQHCWLSVQLYLFTAKDFGLFLSDEDPKKGVWLESTRTLEYYLLRNGVQNKFYLDFLKLLHVNFDSCWWFLGLFHRLESVCRWFKCCIQ